MRRRIVDAGAFAHHARDVGGGEMDRGLACALRSERDGGGEDSGAAVIEQEEGLAIGELAGSRKRHETGCKGGKEQDGVGAGVVEADHHAIAFCKPHLAQRSGRAEHGVLEPRVGPGFGRCGRCRIRDDDQGGLVRRRGGCPREAVAGHVERRIDGGCEERRVHRCCSDGQFWGLTHHVSRLKPNSGMVPGCARRFQDAIHWAGAWNSGIT